MQFQNPPSESDSIDSESDVSGATVAPRVPGVVAALPASEDPAGNTGTQAVIEVGVPINSAIDVAGDADWYRITLTAGTAYTIDLIGGTAPGKLLDPRLYVYTSTGSWAASDDDSGTDLNSRLTFTPTVTGTYYIGAQGFGNGVGTYTLQMSGIAAPPPPPPPVAVLYDTVSIADGDATASSTDGTDFGTVGINATPVTRIFTVRNDTAADMNFGSVLLPTGFTLVDPLAGTLAAGASDTFEVRLDTTSGGSKSGQISFTAGALTYNFAISGFVGIQPSGGDPAGSVETTVQIAPNEQVMGTLEARGDADWYRVTLNEGTEYTISLEGSATSAGTLPDPRVFLHNSAGVSIASDDDSGTGSNSLLRYTPTETGTYYISARAFADGGMGTFLLGVAAAPPPPTPSVTVLGGTTVIADGDTTPASADGTEFGAVDVNGTPVTRTFTVRNDGSGTVQLGSVVLPSGFTLVEPLATSLAAGASDTFEVRMETNTAGLRNGQISFTANDGVSATYNFSVTGAVGSSAGGSDSPGDITTTSTIAAGESVVGNIETRADADWYRITLNAGTPYSISLNGTSTSSGTLSDPKLYLHNSTGVFITGDDDGGAGANSLLVYTPTEAGVYYISARAFADIGTGTYTLSVAAPPPAPDVKVFFSGTAIVDGDTLPGAADGTDFGVTAVGGSPMTRIFTVRNDGAATAALGTVLLPSGYTLVNALVSSLAPGASDTFEVRMDAATSGDRSGTISFTSGTSTFDFAVTGFVSTSAGDPAGDDTTTAYISAGETIRDNLEIKGDIDWYKVILFADTPYAISLEGAPVSTGTLRDPHVFLYDEEGEMVGADDDGGTGVNSLLRITPTETGIYYIAARAFADSAPGSYELTLSLGAPLWERPVAVTQYPYSGIRSVPFDISPVQPYAPTWRTDVGATVMALGTGMVVGIRTGSSGLDETHQGYGNYVTILHDGGFYATYCYFSSIQVELGELVTQGQQLGITGLSGDQWYSTPPTENYLKIVFGTSLISDGTMPRADGTGSTGSPAFFLSKFDSPDEVYPGIDPSDPSTLLSTDIFAMDGVNSVMGSAVANRMIGGEGNDGLIGLGGNDLLVGGTGSDGMDGGSGLDTLIGGLGLDRMNGGADADTFLFLETRDSAVASPDFSATPDQILDFVHGVDRIDLSGIDANEQVDGDQAFVLLQGTALQAFSVTWSAPVSAASVTGNANQYMVYVEADVTGSSGGTVAADMRFILVLPIGQQVVQLDASDFIL